MRCGNWEQLPLTAVQQKYAATDAYAALKLYEVCASCPSMCWRSAEPCVAGDACPDVKLLERAFQCPPAACTAS